MSGDSASVGRLAILIRKARERRGWSQTTLAETARVSDDTIYRLEAGQSDPAFSLVANLTRILDIELARAVFSQKVAAQQNERAE